MNLNINFIGPFKDILPKYIEYKRSLGFKYGQTCLNMLKVMDYFFATNYHIDDISLTKNMVLDYVKKRDNETSSTICLRCSIVRQFAIFLNDIGYTNIYILPTEYIPKTVSNFIPHIFSNKQINLLFNIIDNYQFYSKHLKKYKIYSTLVRLLYGCGLRIGEALSLKISDIDFSNNIIHIFASKNNTSRIVCMSFSLSKVLRDYLFSLDIDNNIWLFPSPKGRSLFTRCC